jgi:hypothetical protein
MNAERERISEGGVKGWESDLNKGRSATYGRAAVAAAQPLTSVGSG